ncbi:hypothetical protein BJX68DRAFT_230933 [Aspergillus pseudodeflectus]|uniref:Uncharacterized protein n=1 Tax=Aspergillus pseudodeflectus TaxID=176178 RepID=A0ABR4KTN6_9EURO
MKAVIITHGSGTSSACQDRTRMLTAECERRSPGLSRAVQSKVRKEEQLKSIMSSLWSQRDRIKSRAKSSRRRGTR